MPIIQSHRQIIRTKFLPCTNIKPSRIKAWCERGSLTVSWDDAINPAENHAFAVRCLLEKFDAEDTTRYGTDKAHGWSAQNYVMGGDGEGMVAVVVPSEGGQNESARRIHRYVLRRS